MPAARRPHAPSRRAAVHPAEPGRGSPTTRPARTSGARVGGPAERVPWQVPRLFTVRAMVLAVVLLLAFVLVYPTLRTYLGERADLSALEVEVADMTEQNAELATQLDRWGDPAYVESQARERLSFVLPGERAYRVADPQTVPEPTTAQDGPTGAVPEQRTLQPWYRDVWDSVRVAGEATAEPAAP